MFSQLDELFGSLEFENSGVARIISIVQELDGLRVQLHVRFEATELASQTWQFVCRDVRAYEFRDESIGTVEFVANHPLLVPYTARWADLSFAGRPSSSSALVGELWEAHQEMTEGWFAFDAFLNTSLKVTNLLASGRGILAEGPRPVLDCYAAVLERHGLRTSYVAEREPREFRDGGWLPEKGGLQALVLTRSYIIGRDWIDVRNRNP